MGAQALARQQVGSEQACGSGLVAGTYERFWTKSVCIFEGLPVRSLAIASVARSRARSVFTASAPSPHIRSRRCFQRVHA
jgi:hypothetical protein